MSVGCLFVKRGRRKLTKIELAVVVANTLGEVDVATDKIPLRVAELGAEDGHPITLERESNVLGGASKFTGAPLEGA